MSRILMISNGHGEDLMASLLADRLLRRARERGDAALSVTGFPLVGEGGAYVRRGIEIAGVQRAMPSGGFIWRSAGGLLADLRAGLLGLARAQMRALAALRDRVDLAVALGDVYCLWLAGRVLRRPTVFVPTAKSEYISGHYGFEYRLMRRYATAIFPRDEPTARAMRDRGLPAEFVGNLMMDALEIEGIDFFAGLPGAEPQGGRGGAATLPVGPVVSLLPGSREDAYENAADLAQVAAALPPSYRFLLSLAPGLNPDRLARRLSEGSEGEGWRFAAAGSVASPAASPGAAKGAAEGVPKGVAGALSRDRHAIVVVQGCFGDVLASADLVVGLAGTGNEQAAGLGKPVVTFPGRGKQFTRSFAETQRKLLGDAVSLVERDPIAVAREVEAILADRDRYERMARDGRRRMGPAGGLDRMAAGIERTVADLA